MSDSDRYDQNLTCFLMSYDLNLFYIIQAEEEKERTPVPKKDGRGRKKGVKIKKEVKEEDPEENLELETEIVERKNKKGPGMKGKGSNLFSRPR